MAILARARALEAEGRDIVHMEVGEPDFPTPEPIVEAGIAALRAGHTHYTPALGLPQLRAAIADYYGVHHGVAIDPGRVCVTPGASGALLLVMAALFDPGDEVLLADPGYPCNRHFARVVEARGVGVPVGPETAFQLTAQLVEQHWGPRTRGVLVANPGNPTGTVIAEAELRAIHAVVKARGGWLIVDEIYHELIYGPSPLAPLPQGEGNFERRIHGGYSKEPSAASLGDDVIVINSFSKYFLMTGWRLGWLLAPPTLMPAIDKLAQNLFLSAPTVAQHAALAALRPETRVLLEARKLELHARRDLLLPELRRLGFDVLVEPAGAFYIYAGIDRFGMDSEAFAEKLLLEAGVAITPGTDFGTHQAERHVRFAYTTSSARIRIALARIAAALKPLLQR
ncbi:MAG: aminotransferase class I/II-fold pyridoxal phosphate-dependent enzyme [Pseudomonadota bacterium]|nr:aminotransferase class I/II-fold pyridoxal phosphate-dependent enzyme [Pseudomonadota bacterium]MDP1904080.1 aminotransferase class I/II-fold pyridoxal phosphate-dependent enzyme [Pseudomonadota bacterium]MDP2354195.1 aminotransferase class I/II-fold pyridoxal phosphate-dependent enzyme [Pseudomonadota bacterium]